jgi:hypothetical protein
LSVCATDASTTLLALGGGEREFGRSKHAYGLAFLRVRGIERVRLRADLTMLARLTLALSQARAVSPAA